VNAGLSTKGLNQALEPQARRGRSSIENGLWKLLPTVAWKRPGKFAPTLGGRTELHSRRTTFVFTARMLQDKDLEFIVEPGGRYRDHRGPDPQTVTIRWKRLSIEADELSLLTTCAPSRSLATFSKSPM